MACPLGVAPTIPTEHVYVLLCSENKFYVGKTARPLPERIREHVEGRGSAWTRKYPPIRVIESHPCETEVSEDTTTKKWMRLHGVDNVRGGSYSQVVLPDYRRRSLQDEFNGASDRCFKCQKPGHFARHCTAQAAETPTKPSPLGTATPTKSPKHTAPTATRISTPDEVLPPTAPHQPAGTSLPARTDGTTPEQGEWVLLDTPPSQPEATGGWFKSLVGVVVDAVVQVAVSSVQQWAAGEPQRTTHPRAAQWSVCSRCGRTSHNADTCFARSHADGRRLF